MTTAFEERTRRAGAVLEDAGADAFILGPGPNLYYLTAIDEEPSERPFLLILPAGGEPTFLVPELAGEQVREKSRVDDVRTWSDDEDPWERFPQLLDRARERVLVDDRLPAAFVLEIEAALPEASLGLASEVLAELRARKDATELDALRRAATIADRVSREVRKLGVDAVGTTEAELAREIDRRMVEAGGEQPSFGTIVASGPNGASPHHRAGDRTIGEGDPVVLDFGCYVNGYPSDQTRTVVFAGEPPVGFEPVYEAVRDAQEAALGTVAPGVAAGEVDLAARAVIEERGFGEAFVHRTGHGVGLDIHEPPYIVAGNDLELEPGMVFSVEPGVYLDDEFGVRVEDLVVVTHQGAERLNTSPRGWQS